MLRVNFEHFKDRRRAVAVIGELRQTLLLVINDEKFDIRLKYV